ncbi:MAG: hypothetical protein KKA73_30700 [Chloroflexi bacterium]|nr:hypothetical protein [Chloroflexota bacterium]MBU1752071.1 hypothetical protein [Chloroflexota bacterium]
MDLLELPIVRTVRRNHAAEHATMTMLSQHVPGVRLVARSSPRGFTVYGDVHAQALRQAAEEALTRLQAGEANLAVHPNCGTNLVVGGLLTALAAVLLMGRRPRLDRLPFVLLGTTLALIAAQPAGRWTQKHITTSPDLAGTWVASVRRVRPGVHKVAIAQRLPQRFADVPVG